ncbi:hypothetical protein EUTSA_v10002158mg [Eutrema salsugineum]|uniref:Uncharacterized protein n=1 Tax=Eutrema salsugineum TaxID=72664 RepID=V4LI94_EUTSA|nr:hypothetical protein EUTSA_v10002158mg [Eutrema salsugineum]
MSHDVKFHEAVMTEYNGKLAVLWPEINYPRTEREIRCALITLDWIGDGIHGKIEWSGTVAVPYDSDFRNCLVVSD